MKSTILKKGSMAIAVMGFGALLSACGGGGGGSASASTSSSGSGSGFTTTSAYIQDDVSNYPNVTVGIYSISLANTGDGHACVLFSSSTPVYINLASLSGIAQYISTTACPSDAYNRLDIVLSNTVSVITPTNYTPTMCTLTSYNPNSNTILPNTVNCGSGSTCLLDMTGNIGGLSGTNSYLDVDFDLRDSYISISTTPSTTSCQVSFATRPITMENENEPYDVMLSLRGHVSNLSNTAFSIVKDDNTYMVSYTALPASSYSLLQSASSNYLKVAVVCSSFTNNICSASIITQTVSGIYQGYSNTSSLTLSREDSASTTIPLFNPTIYPNPMTWSSFTAGGSFLLVVNMCSVSGCTSNIYYTGNVMIEDEND